MNVGKKGKRKSRTTAIIIAFRIVPMPGVCFNGIQQSRTKELVTKVASPTLHPVKLVIPCAKTVHGLTPRPAAISKASPRPKRMRPITRKKMDINGGLNVRAFGELQKRKGMFFRLRNW